MTTPVLELRNIDKSFGPIDVLHEISLTMNKGEVLCLLGDNGAGKSTLIKTLAGVHKPTRGTILMDGNEVSFDRPRDAQEMGINGVLNDDLLVSVMNPAGQIHFLALMVGYLAVAFEQKKEEVPDLIYVPSPVIDKENAAGYQYLANQFLI